MPSDDFFDDLHFTKQVRAFLKKAQVKSIVEAYAALADSLVEIGKPRLSKEARRERESAIVALSRTETSDFWDRLREPQMKFGGAVPLMREGGPTTTMPLARDPAGMVAATAPGMAPTTTAVSPAGFALSDEFFEYWPAKWQGDRQTCVAFATTACIELLNSGGDVNQLEAVSRQHLYFYMREVGKTCARQPQGWEKGATLLRHARKVLRKYGYCPNADCLYYDAVSRLEGQTPSDEANAKALAAPGLAFEYKDYPPETHPTTGVADEIIAELAASRPVAVAVATFGTGQNAETAWAHAKSDGIVRSPLGDPPIDAATSGHVICVFRFEPDPNDPSGGWFIFKNSWGSVFAANLARAPLASRLAPSTGFGALSRKYVDKYCWEWLSFRADPGAPDRPG